MCCGSHLTRQQPRPVVERYGDVRVIRAQRCLPNFRRPPVQRLSLGELTLRREGQTCTSVVNTNGS